MLCSAATTPSLGIYGFVIKNRFWNQTDVGLNPDSPLLSWVTLGKSLDLSNPHVCEMRVLSTYLLELL